MLGSSRLRRFLWRECIPNGDGVNTTPTPHSSTLAIATNGRVQVSYTNFVDIVLCQVAMFVVGRVVSLWLDGLPNQVPYIRRDSSSMVQRTL